MIKAIIFDIGGVLTKANGTTHDQMAKALNITLSSWHKKISPEYQMCVRGKISEKNALANISRRIGISEKKFEKIWIDGFKKAHKKNTTTLKLAKKLKKNYKAAILSDQLPLADKHVISKMNFYKFFNPAVISYKVGTRKPEPGIYLIILNRLGLKPQECVFIDDFKENIVSARKLGINSIQFKNNKQLENDLRKLGVKI